MDGDGRNCIEGSVVFVTGASGGIGQEWVRQALERGAAKVYAADIASRNWDSDRVTSLELDVTDEQSIARSAMLAPDTTILINNAGVSLRDKMAEVASDKLRRAFDVNFFGPVALSQQFAPILGQNGGGAIVNVLSTLSWVAIAGGYSAAKAALWSATNSMRVELLPQKTHVLAVHMGYVDTLMTAAINLPKTPAGDVARAAFDALEALEYEVVVDELSRAIRCRLGGPLTDLYPQLIDPEVREFAQLAAHWSR